MRMNLAGRVLFSLLAALGVAASPAEPPGARLVAGPMLGYSEPREVLLWAQTSGPARVKFVYWDEAVPEGPRHETDEKATVRSEAFIARLVADRLAPGRRYAYEIHVDGRRVERPYPLRFQSRMPRAAFGGGPTGLTSVRVALGSCFWAPDPAEPTVGRRGEDYGIFAAIAARQPDLMLWLGDNVYLRDMDASSRTGLLERYGHNRALSELQSLLGSTHHYAVWDDHDYGPNDSDRSYRDKHWAREAFTLYWGNPSAGIEGSPGITTRFDWADVEFFLLDNRWNRSPIMRSTGKRQVFGRGADPVADRCPVPEPCHLQGGGLWRPGAEPRAHGRDLRQLPRGAPGPLAADRGGGVRGVLFVTGDRHFTELARLDRPGTYPLYDLTVSPLATWVERNGDRERNTLRVPGTLVSEQNFGTLEVEGLEASAGSP